MKRLLIFSSILLLACTMNNMANAETKATNPQDAATNKAPQQNKPAENAKTNTETQLDPQIFGGPPPAPPSTSSSTKKHNNPLIDMLNQQKKQ